MARSRDAKLEALGLPSLAIDVLGDPFPAPPDESPSVTVDVAKLERVNRLIAGAELELPLRARRRGRPARGAHVEAQWWMRHDAMLRRVSAVEPTEPRIEPPTLSIAATDRARWPSEVPIDGPSLAIEPAAASVAPRWPAMLLALLHEPHDLGLRREVRDAADRFESIGDVLRASAALAALSFVPRHRSAAPTTMPSAERVRAIAAFDVAGQRLTAIQLAENLATAHDDAGLAEVAANLRARLVRGSVFDAAILGEPLTIVLDASPIVGRKGMGASIGVASNLVSREHLRMRLVAGAVSVEDLGSRNGTQTATGEALVGPLLLGAGLRLLLGGEVPCSIAPAGGGSLPLSLFVGGTRHLLGLGSLAVGGFHLTLRDDVVPRVELSGAGFLNGEPFSGHVDLCHGDCVSVASESAPVIRVCDARRSCNEI